MDPFVNCSFLNPNSSGIISCQINLPTVVSTYSSLIFIFIGSLNLRFSTSCAKIAASLDSYEGIFSLSSTSSIPVK